MNTKNYLISAGIGLATVIVGTLIAIKLNEAWQKNNVAAPLAAPLSTTTSTSESKTATS